MLAAIVLALGLASLAFNLLPGCHLMGPGASAEGLSTEVPHRGLVKMQAPLTTTQTDFLPLLKRLRLQRAVGVKRLRLQRAVGAVLLPLEKFVVDKISRRVRGLEEHRTRA